MKSNPVGWFEIYVQDMARTKTFYETVFQGTLAPLPAPPPPEGEPPDVEMEMLSRDLSYLVEVKDELISLTPLQLCARDIEVVLGDVGKLPVAELESQYEAKFGRELPLEPLGFESVSELLAAMNDTLSVSGRGIR